MARVTITLTDDENDTAKVDLDAEPSVKFDGKTDLTNAQWTAALLLKAIPMIAANDPALLEALGVPTTN